MEGATGINKSPPCSHVTTVLQFSPVPGQQRDQESRDQQKLLSTCGPLTAKDLEIFTSMLHGNLALARVPRIQPQVIRLCVSSTPSDMDIERDILAEHVFPELRKYCRDEYGVEFQAVDLRWNLAEEEWGSCASDLFLSEIRKCQASYIGPNFAVFLGETSSPRPLPSAVADVAYHAICKHLSGSGNDISLLDQCYHRDLNVAPSVYRLLQKHEIEAITACSWKAAEARLSWLISHGARLAVDCGDLTADNVRQYTTSVFQQEVHLGLLSVADAKVRENSCILFLRETDDAEEFRNSELAKRVSEVASDTDSAQATVQDSLKTTCLKALPSSNCYTAKVKWTGKEIDRGDEEAYLDQVSSQLFRKIRALVDACMRDGDTAGLRHWPQAAQMRPAVGDLYGELGQHWVEASDRCATFVGREAHLTTVYRYICGKTCHPLVICGESGVGKSSLLARVASEVHTWTSGKMRTSLIVRFIGLTARSCSLQPLLYWLCRQIAVVSGKSSQVVPEYSRRLKNHFINFLQRGEFPGLMVIILDGLDLLSPSDGAHSLDWLPALIAPNVKVIVSVSSRNRILTKRLENKVCNSLECLPPLSVQEAERMLELLLEAARRRVTVQQLQLVRQALHHCCVPLFVSLLFQEASRWCSYEVIRSDALPHRVEDGLEKLLESLEVRHGKVLVSRALGYVTACHRGVSVTELEDILSMDDDVLQSVLPHDQPRLRRVPPLLWARLQRDLAVLLTERNWNGALVLSWRHQQFAQTATRRYLRESVDCARAHRVLAEYYQGTRNGTFQKTSAVSQVGGYQAKASRLVPEMPLVFCSSFGEKRFNLRKMSQLPHALCRSYQVERLKWDCMCSYAWLHAKLCATSVQQVLEDFEMLEDREVSLVAEALRMSSSVLRKDADRLGMELSGRLLPHASRYPAVRDLVRQCDLAAQKCCPLVPLAQLYEAPGGPLQHQFALDFAPRSADDVNAFACSDSIILTVKQDSDATLKVWDVHYGQPRQELRVSAGRALCSRDGRYLCVLRDNRFIGIYDTNSGDLLGTVDYEYGEVSTVAVGSRYIAISVERGVGPVVVDLQEATQVHRFALHTDAVTFGSDEDTLVVCSGRQVLLFSLPLMERKAVGEASDVPQQVYLSALHSTCFLLTRAKVLQAISFSRAVQPRARDLFCDLDLRDFTVSHDENLILCRSARHLYVLDARGQNLARQLQQVPPGLCRSSTTSFCAAGFSLDDSLVVGGRHTLLLVWSVASGQLLRALQESLTPIAKLCLFHGINKAVAFLADNTVQVWNLNNVEEGVLHINKIVHGAVKSVAVTSTAGCVACQGETEVKLVDLGTGRVTGTLQHGPSVERVLNVSFSPGGRYLLTSCLLAKGEEEAEEQTDWSQLCNFVLWDADQQKSVYSQVNSRFAFFDQHGTSLGVIHWVVYNPLDWTSNWYQFTFLQLEGGVRGHHEQHFDLPENSELVGCPSLFCRSVSQMWALVSVLQMCYKMVGDMNQATQHSFETLVYIQFVPGREAGSSDSKSVPHPSMDARYVRLQDLIGHHDAADHIAHVAVLQDEMLLITYVKGINHFLFDPSLALVIPADAEKGAIIYDPIKDIALKHLPQVWQNIYSMLSSTMPSLSVEKHLLVSSSTDSHKLGSALTELYPDSVRPLLDSRYIVGLTYDRENLMVYRISDGVHKGSLLIHGKACCIAVAEDGRTVAVGTEDGRVMLLAFVLELFEPYIKFIQNLPSRNPFPSSSLHADAAGVKISSHCLLDDDLQVIYGVESDMLYLSAKQQLNPTVAASHQPSFTRISNAVLVTQKLQHAQSQACCIQ